MATPVQMWKSEVGRLFETQQQADQWDNAWKALMGFKHLSETQRDFMYRRLLEMVEDGWQFVPPDKPAT